jgi:DNA-binding MarR family transcriptional regulator
MEQLDIVALIKVAQRLERNVTVALMYSGLRIPQFRLLDELDAMGVATVTALSEQLHITRATASVMIAELVSADIVVMIENPEDRRSFHIRLTRHGMGKLEVARKDLGVLQGELSGSFSGEMVLAVNEFARRVVKPRKNSSLTPPSR